MFNLFIPLAFALFLSLILGITYPGYVATKRRHSGFGIVFNGQTGEPEASVLVRILNIHKLVVRSAVTDKQGRYRLVAPPGEYYFDIVKKGFQFLSSPPNSKLHHYSNLLPSSHIVINDFGAITKNIPVVPEGIKTHAQKSFHLPHAAQSHILFWGTLLAIAGTYYWRNILSVLIIFGIYLLALIYRVISFKPAKNPFGTILDAATGKPIEQVIVRIFEKKFNKLLETQITSPKGRYAFVINPGSYSLRITKSGYKTVIVNYPKIRQDGFLLARDIKLKKSSKSA